MASWVTLSTVLLLAFLIVVNDVDFTAGKGGRGGRSGGRSSSRGSRSSRYSRSRSSGSSGSSRAYKGSYGYTRSNWMRAFRGGKIYGGIWYLRSTRYYSNRNRMPTICKNIYKADTNGTIFNLFVCPQKNDPANYDYCCGPVNQEYCCAWEDSPWRIIVTVVFVCLFVIMLGVFLFRVCKGTLRSCCKCKGSCKKEKRATPPKGSEVEMDSAPPPYSPSPAYIPSDAYTLPNAYSPSPAYSPPDAYTASHAYSNGAYRTDVYMTSVSETMYPTKTTIV